MDLSKFSTEDLQAMRAGNLRGMSDQGLSALREQRASAGPDEGGPDEPFSEKMGRYGSNASQALGKAAGVLRAASTGPITGSLMELAGNGKKAYSAADVKGALNPQNLDQFPDNKTMAARVGLKNPSLSDAFPSLYDAPGTKTKVYGKGGATTSGSLMEKGGMLDPTLYGALQIPTDPAMWMGAGEEGAAAKAMSELSMGQKAANMVGAPVKAVGTLSGARPLAKALSAAPYLGKGVETLTNPIGAVTAKLGKSIYGSTLGPVENEGQKWGKDQVIDRLQQAGVWSPFHMQDKVQKATDALNDSRGALFQEAAYKGATVDVAKGLEPAYAEAARLRHLGGDANNRIADALEKELDSHMALVSGTPGTPGKPAVPPGPSSQVERQSALLDEYGKPMTTMETVPGAPGQPAVPATPGIPPKQYTPQLGSDVKTSITNKLDDSTFNPNMATPEGQRGMRNAGAGLKNQVEQSVEKVIPGGGADTADLNDALGALLATKKSQLKVNQTAKDALRKAATITPMDAILGFGTSAMTGDPIMGMGTVLGKKLLQSTQPITTMPVGFATQKLGESNVLDRLNELLQENKNGKSKRR